MRGQPPDNLPVEAMPDTVRRHAIDLIAQFDLTMLDLDASDISRLREALRKDGVPTEKLSDDEIGFLTRNSLQWILTLARISLASGP